jgi:hypothetical protein
MSTKLAVCLEYLSGEKIDGPGIRRAGAKRRYDRVIFVDDTLPTRSALSSLPRGLSLCRLPIWGR